MITYILDIFNIIFYTLYKEKTQKNIYELNERN